MPTIEDLGIPMTASRSAFIEDDLRIRFWFQTSLTSEQKTQFETIVNAWEDNPIAGGNKPEVLAAPRWYTKNTLAVIDMDIGGAREFFFESLYPLFQQINELSPLERIRFEDIPD